MTVRKMMIAQCDGPNCEQSETTPSGLARDGGGRTFPHRWIHINVLQVPASVMNTGVSVFCSVRCLANWAVAEYGGND